MQGRTGKSTGVLAVSASQISSRLIPVRAGHAKDVLTKVRENEVV